MPSFCNAVCVVVTDCLCATRPKLNTHRECATKKKVRKKVFPLVLECTSTGDYHTTYELSYWWRGAIGKNSTKTKYYNRYNPQ